MRFNPAKGYSPKKNLVLGPVPWENHAWLLKERPLFVADPGFHAGCFYVQESSSAFVGMAVEQLLPKLKTESIVLDLCAAPGGKSTHLASLLRKGDILVANETIHSRTAILHENLCKWGASNHIITRADSARLGSCGIKFQLILADMPCSGEGLFRKDTEAVKEWSMDAVNMCAERQRRIASDIWPALDSGGYFIYSTCTFNAKENEENVRWICDNLGAEIVPVSIDKEWQIFSMESGMYRLLPHRVAGEGFFCAVLQKTGENEKTKKPAFIKNKFQNYTHSFGDSLQAFVYEDKVFGMQTNNLENVYTILHQLPAIYSPSTPLGQIFRKHKGHIFKPDTSLALIANINLDMYPKLTLDDEEILQFLGRQSLSNNNKIAGLQQVLWNDISFGFVNAINNSMNNLWPLQWRIRMELKTKAVTILNLEQR